MVCAYCGQDLTVYKLTGTPIRYLVRHTEWTEMHDMIGLITGTPFQFCLNNAKQWVIDLYQPKIYPVDVVTGEIDTFGGRL